MTPAPHGEEWKMMEAAAGLPDPDAREAELEAARKRIASIRQTDAELILLGPGRQPLPGLELEIEQTRSAFLWGEQLWQLDTLFRNGFRDSARVRHFTSLFTGCLNSANCLAYWTEAPRNDGPKHMEFQGEDRLDGFAAQVEWALANGLTPKGHPLFWSLPKAWPSWLARYPFDTQWKFAEVRVRNLVARFKGRVKIWDAVNEPLWEAAPKNLPRRRWPHIESLDDLCEYIIPVLRWAREEDPAARYLINDYGLELDTPGRDLRDAAGQPVTAARQRRRLTALFRRLRDEGACPDGLGMQAHTGAWMTPATQLAILDELAETGVPLHYTEFWTRSPALDTLDPAEAAQLRARYLTQAMTVAFSHPAVESFFVWGDLVESFGFRPDPNSPDMPSSSNEPGVIYESVRRLLRHDFMTRCRAVTGQGGRVRFRGFFGDYILRFRSPSGIPAGLPFTLDPSRSGPLTITLHSATPPAQNSP